MTTAATTVTASSPSGDAEPKLLLGRDLDPEAATALRDKYSAKGWAPVKVDFIVVRQPRAPQGEKDKQESNSTTSDGGPPPKRAKLKGRNKKRPGPTRPVADPALPVLCSHVVSALADEPGCPFGASCRYSHDLAAYMAARPPDLGPECSTFVARGRCDLGVTCRFGSGHVDAQGRNVVDAERWAAHRPTRNRLSPNLQVRLRKRQYDFQRSFTLLDSMGLRIDARQRRGPKGATEAKEETAGANNEAEGICEKKEGVKGAEAEPILAIGTQEETIGVKEESEGAARAKETAVEANGEAERENEESTGVVDATGGSLEVFEVTEKPVEAVDLPAEPKVAMDHGGDDSQVSLRPAEKRQVDFAGKLYLAPLTTVGNLPFRRVCKELGADITCGEMAMATNLLQGKKAEWALLKRHPSETVFGVQLCGGYPDMMTKCAQLVSEQCEVDFIDVNCGCPIDLVYQRGEGSGLMRNQRRLEDIVRGMSAVLDCPLTVKMRTGVHEDKNTAHTMLASLRDCGAALVTVHGRTREQRYTRLADWDYIRTCADAARPMPLFGNGDVLSWEDAQRCRDASGVAGVMLGRGALIKPWLFTELKEQRHWDISAGERLDILRRFANYGLEHWGSDARGVETTRRFLLEWLSFLHRYIPVGLLERLPQRINEKPPQFVGRSDLETLLASGSCADWIKVSEMLLGPVPGNFVFLPKHKANSYQAPSG